MSEVQSHGFSFEKWVRDHFFEGYQGSYMQKWDVPLEYNVSAQVPVEFRKIPVSIKTAKLGTPIGLGDVLRQRQIDQDFLMIVGFWEQRTPTEKWIVEIGYAVLRMSDWNLLWGQLTLEEIRSIDTAIKNTGEHYSAVRTLAKTWKAQAAAKKSIIVINPKIDSKKQRRIQCSLPYATFLQMAPHAKLGQHSPELWGQAFPNPISSTPRSFH